MSSPEMIFLVLSFPLKMIKCVSFQQDPAVVRFHLSLLHPFFGKKLVKVFFPKLCNSKMTEEIFLKCFPIITIIFNDSSSDRNKYGNH